MPPLIGVTIYAPDEKGRYHYLPAAYTDAVRRAGGVPVLIPPGEKETGELLDHLDGLVLTGGGDIDPFLYGGSRHEAVYMVDRARDDMEIDLVRRVADRGFPTLGICRGAQVINVALGGTLIEHVPDVVGEKVLHRLPGRDASRHGVELEAGCRLARILSQTRFEVASSHHQAVKRPAEKLRVCGRASDGIVEAFELPGHPWLFGVQWHPEITAAEDPVQQRLFRALVEAAERS